MRPTQLIASRLLALLPALALLLTLLPGTAQAALKEEIIIVNYLNNFAKNVKWPEWESGNDFKIAILGRAPKNVEAEIKRFSKSNRILRRAITVENVRSIWELKDAQMVYAYLPTQATVSDFYTIFGNKPVMLVTHGFNYPQQTMINLSSGSDGSVTFQANKANLINQGLIPTDELIIYGGTEIEIAKLYQDGQRALTQLEGKLAELNKYVKEKKAEVDTQTFKNNVLANSIREKEAENLSLEKKINQQIKQLDFNQKNYANLQKSIDSYKKDYADLQVEIESREKTISELSEHLKKSDTYLRKVESELDGKKEELSQTQKLIEASRKKLSEQNEELKSKLQEQAELEEVISIRTNEAELYRTITILVVILAISIISAFLALKRSNKKLIERESNLEESLEKLSRAEAQLKEAAESARKESYQKTRFLAFLSHDIRTPMNAIIGFSKILNDKVTDPGQKKAVSIINSAAGNLLTLTDDVLDLSRVEAGKIKIINAPASIPKIISETVSMLVPIVSDKDLSLKVELDRSKMPEQIMIDHRRLRQILINLLSNSAKYTEQGQITIKADTVEESSQKARRITLNITVSDTGTGINKSDLERIFLPYEQATEDLYSKGSGLGLAICKHFIDLMDGNIEIISEVNEGTDVHVSFHGLEVCDPAEAHAPKATLAAAGSKAVKLRPARILIADDMENNRELIKALLEDQPLQFVEAGNGMEALEIIREDPPDLVLLDMKMPVMNGYQTCKIIKSDPALEHIPVIAVTAAVIKSLQKAELSLCDGMVKKPIDDEILLNELAKYLSAEN